MQRSTRLSNALALIESGDQKALDAGIETLVALAKSDYADDGGYARYYLMKEFGILVQQVQHAAYLQAS